MNRVQKRRRADAITKGVVYLFSSIAIFILAAIIVYVFRTGSHLVTWDIIVGDSADINTDVYVEVAPGDYSMGEYNGKEELYFSENWGIGFVDTFDKEGHEIVEVGYVSPDSPFMNALDKNNSDENGRPNIVSVNVGTSVEKGFLDNSNQKIILGLMGAETIAKAIDESIGIDSLTVQIHGGGIRGSIITTLYLIVMTLILALPIGVSTAIYFNEYAKKSRFSEIVRYLVDLLTGVPSIIYGLLGAAVFIPFMNSVVGTTGGSILSGALTMAVILLPVIIKSTEEALKVISRDVRSASLALGASKTQTTFKVVLPSAVPGILTGVLLSIGRIIGESAALIFAIGAAIKDRILLTERATTLAVHIWTIMGGEAPNYELASAIAIIILMVVVVMSLLVKLIAKRLNKAWY